MEKVEEPRFGVCRGWAMAKKPFVSRIKPIAIDFFEDVVGEAEARYSDNSYSFLDPRVRVAKVKEYAQMLMISRLVEMKGDWLSLIEMQFALDVFHACCKTHVPFHALRKEGVASDGILSQAREYLASQNAEEPRVWKKPKAHH